MEYKSDENYNGPLTDEFFILLTTHMFMLIVGIVIGAAVVVGVSNW